MPFNPLFYFSMYWCHYFLFNLLKLSSLKVKFDAMIVLYWQSTPYYTSAPPQKKNILQLVYASLLQADIVLVTVSEHSATNTGSLQGKL